MNSSRLYELLELPLPIRELYETYDQTRSLHITSPDLQKRLLTRATWPDAEKELEARIGDDPDGLIILWEMLHEALNTWERYCEKGISLDIFRDTMAYATRYLNDAHKQTGRYRFVAPWWFPRELSMEEFRIEALEYELSHENDIYRVSIHIPSDADLSPASLDTSMRAFVQFQNTYYPAWQHADWYCDSWLMSPALQELLPENSRILGFQNRFDLVSWNENSMSALNWVFPGSKTIDETLPEDTSLQRNMKAYLLAGKSVGWALAKLREKPVL